MGSKTSSSILTPAMPLSPLVGGVFFALFLFVTWAVVGEEPGTLAEWERIIVAEDLHWRTGGRGGRDEWIEHLTTLASNKDADLASESRKAAFKLGTFFLKMETSGHSNNLQAWRWFREGGGDDHALTQLALGYVFLSLAEEYETRSHRDKIAQELESIGEPAISALEKAVAREDDNALKRAAAQILHDVRKRMEERK